MVGTPRRGGTWRRRMRSAGMIPFTEVLKARERLANRVLLTPMRGAPGLDRRTGQHVRLKCEHQQTTGSFKLRGATNALLLLDEEQRRRGVVAASTGNHGRALAHAARQMGVPAVICMSSLVPANNVEAIEALGATVRIIGRSQDDAQREVDRLVSDDGLVMVAPFDDPAVIAGQGTLGLELMEQAPDTGSVLVPLSGGGLIAGVALAVKTVSPQTHVIGVSMETSPIFSARVQNMCPPVPRAPASATQTQPCASGHCHTATAVGSDSGTHRKVVSSTMASARSVRERYLMLIAVVADSAAASSGTRLAARKPSAPGRTITSTPTKPTSTAVQRRTRTTSPRKMTAPTVTKSGVE